MLDPSFTPLVIPRVGETPVDVRDAASRARTRGYADGFAEGRRMALEEAARRDESDRLRAQRLEAEFAAHRRDALTAVDAAQRLLEHRTSEVSALSADRIEELAVVLAQTILGAELSDPARSSAHALRRALDAMPVRRWTRVTFSEQDAALLRPEAEDDGILHGVEITDSSTVDAGGAIVEIEHGAVDTRISEALARAAAMLRGEDEPGAEALR